MTAILGKKIGMTQVFTEDERLLGVCAIQAGPCTVLSVKDKSLQVAFEPVEAKRLNKPLQGYFKKLNLPTHRIIAEVVKGTDKEYKVGDTLNADLFKPGDFVDVVGTSIGKGFQGGMKRWNWSGGPMTHGSMSHRRVGSLGSSTTPGRVWKGHHLPGHMGNVRVTVQNLRVIKVDAENNVILVKGAVPGHKNSYLLIRKAKKKSSLLPVGQGHEPAAKAQGKPGAKPQAAAKGKK